MKTDGGSSEGLVFDLNPRVHVNLPGQKMWLLVVGVVVSFHSPPPETLLEQMFTRLNRRPCSCPSRRVTPVSSWYLGPRTGPTLWTPPCVDRDALTRSWRFVANRRSR